MLMDNRVLLWLLCCGAVGALPIGEFYPHGPNVDKSLPKVEDISSTEIFLTTPITFFGELHSSLFVSWRFLFLDKFVVYNPYFML